MLNRYALPLAACLGLMAAPSAFAMEPKILADARLRYENVDDARFTSEADALTLRARLGLSAEIAPDLEILVEGSHTALLIDDFNSTTNKKIAFPVVADPRSTRLNRLQASYQIVPELKVTVGRQRLIFQDARFIGNVGFRQQEQSFDAARATFKPLENLTIDYVYTVQANRIFGNKSTMGTHDLDGHIVEAAYKTGHGVTLTGFYHHIENDDAQALSLATYGARVDGSIDMGGGYTLLIDGAYAHQKDIAQNPASLSHNFMRAVGGVKRAGLILKGGIEQLEGNGTTAFQTPLATVHKFQGYSDVFLATPAGGVKDRFVTLAYKGDKLHGLKPVLAYHDFKAESGGMDYGTEFDAILTYKATKQITLQGKYANFDSDGLAADIQKIWLAATFVY